MRAGVWEVSRSGWSGCTRRCFLVRDLLVYLPQKEDLWLWRHSFEDNCLRNLRERERALLAYQKGMSVFVEVNLNSSSPIAGTVVFLCTFEQVLPAFKEQ